MRALTSGLITMSPGQARAWPSLGHFKSFAGLRVLSGDAAYAAIPVRWGLERGDWTAAAGLEPAPS